MRAKNRVMTKKEIQNIVKCPYIPQHVMSLDSLMTHLNRCKATNKHLFKSCMYNCLHVIPKEQYDEHVESCEDRFKHEFTESFVTEQEDESWEESFERTNQNTSSKRNSKHSSDQSPHNHGNGRVDMGPVDRRSSYFNNDEYQQSSLYDKQKLMHYQPAQNLKNGQQFFMPNDFQPFDNPRDKLKKPVKKLNQTIGNGERQNDKPWNSKSQKDAIQQQGQKIRVGNQQLSDKDTHSQSSKDNKKSSSEEQDILAVMRQLETSMRVDSLNQSKDQLGDLLVMEASMLKKEHGKKNKDEKTKLVQDCNWSILSEL